MSFYPAWDVLLLKAVYTVDAHVPPQGEIQAQLEEELVLLQDHDPADAPGQVFSPTWKALNERFKKIVVYHRLAVRHNSVAYGNIEVRGEREVLLDDLVLGMDEVEEKRRAERDKRKVLDTRLRAAAEDMRSNDLSRKGSLECSADDGKMVGSRRGGSVGQ